MLLSAGMLGRSNQPPFTTVPSIGGDLCLINCSTVSALDRYMFSGNSTGLTASELELFNDYVKYSNEEIPEQPELKALDDMFYMLTTTALSCAEIQGVTRAN